MTRIAYLDCFAGISGDMLLGALVDVGWPEQNLRELIAKLKLGDVQLKVERISKRGIAATQVNVISSPHQPHRGLRDLASIVMQAELPQSIQQRAISALKLLAEAESQVDLTIGSMLRLRTSPAESIKEAFADYRENVGLLDEQGKKAKDRAAAMRDEADAHIKAWQKEMETISDPAITREYRRKSRNASPKSRRRQSLALSE